MPRSTKRGWRENRARGNTSLKSQTGKLESGEELMVPYHQLSERAKELDRTTVRAVYAAIEAAMRAKRDQG